MAAALLASRKSSAHAHANPAPRERSSNEGNRNGNCEKSCVPEEHLEVFGPQVDGEEVDGSQVDGEEVVGAQDRRSEICFEEVSLTSSPLKRPGPTAPGRFFMPHC